MQLYCCPVLKALISITQPSNTQAHVTLRKLVGLAINEPVTTQSHRAFRDTQLVKAVT
jgi:hypothetical protein